jgi:CDP-glucose 4,6-dehydratase
MTPRMSMQEALARYRGRRVLVTGHTGFKGSWLALWLRELGAHVSGLALPMPKPNHADLVGLEGLVTHHDVDIRDLAAVERVFAAEQPEVVFHLAAQPLVRLSYETPKETFDVNVGGTVNVLEAVRTTKSVTAAVMITSDKAYENREWVYAYRENDPMGGHDPYSASKGAAEIVIASYRRSFGQTSGRPLGIASTRAGNVIGGGDFAVDRIIPDCVRALAAGEPVHIRSPHAVRPWQHVLEPLSGYLVLGAHLFDQPRRFSDAYNFGPLGDELVPVEPLARTFLDVWGSGTLRIDPPKDAPHEAHLLRLACDKAVMELGWRPLLSTREAISWSARWYRAWNEKRSLIDLSREQIAQYRAAMGS